jgi:hypothetical protein
MERVMDRSMGKAYRIKSFLTNFRTKYVYSFLPLIFFLVPSLRNPMKIPANQRLRRGGRKKLQSLFLEKDNDFQNPFRPIETIWIRIGG